MSCSSASGTIICQEVFDENSLPSEEEVLQYAKRIGINPETEGYLLSIARHGLMQALPPGWKPVYDDKLKRYYYFNFENGSSRWDHPLDDYYKAIVKKKRSDAYCSTGEEEDSKTSIREDLKSYEEPPDTSSDTMHNSRSRDNQRIGKTTTKRFTSPSGDKASSSSVPPLTTRPPLPPRRGRSVGLVAPVRVGGSTSPSGRRSPSPVSGLDRRPRGLQLGPGTRDTGQPSGRIDIDAMPPLSSVTPSLDDRSPQDKPFKPHHPIGSGLKLTGCGSMFLKSRQKNNNTTSSSVSPQSTATSPSFEQRRVTESDSKEQGAGQVLAGFDLDQRLVQSNRFENVHDDVDSLQSLIDEVASKVESHSSHDVFPLKGILRDSSPTNRSLWDVDPAQMTAEEKAVLKNQELEDERKRSVRFADFEKLPLDIRFEMPESEDSLTPSSEGKEVWESDGDMDERLIPADYADSSRNNNELKKELYRNELDNLNLKTNTFDEKVKIKTNWLEIRDQTNVEVNTKDESELLNRLVKLKRKENAMYIDNTDNKKTEGRLMNKNVKCLNKIQNNNYSPDAKLDLWEENTTEELDRNSKDNSIVTRGNLVTNSNVETNANNTEKVPESETKSTSSSPPSDADLGNSDEFLLDKTRNEGGRHESLGNRTIKSSINDLLHDIKSFTDIQEQKDVSNQNNIKTKRKNDTEFMSEEDKLLKNNSKSSDTVNSSYRRHYFIDENMMSRIDVSEDEMYNPVRSPRSLDHLSALSSDRIIANTKLKRPREFDNGSEGEVSKKDETKNLNLSENLVENDVLFCMENQYKEKDADMLEVDEFDDNDNGSKKVELKYSQSSGVSKNSINNNSKRSNEHKNSAILLGSGDFENDQPVLNSERRVRGELLDGSDSIFDVNRKSSGNRIEDTLEEVQDKLMREMEIKLAHLQKEQDERLDAARKEFQEKEKAEFERLEAAMNEKLDLLRQELKEQEEKRRIAMREISETSLEEFKRQLEVEKEEKIKKLEEEQKSFLEKQEEISQAECKRVEDETNHRVQASVHILAKFVEEVKQREEKEIDRIKSESEERMEIIKKDYQAKQDELAETMKKETEALETEMEERLSQARLRCQQKSDEEERLAEMTRKERREAEWRRQQEELVNTADEHLARMQVLREQCKQEEESLRKKHAEKVEMLNIQINRALEKDSVDITQLTRDFEKVRCEKRLLEDKYRTLKEKYIKLKNDIRLSLERKRQAKLNRKNREQSTTEDTDRSTSHSRTEPQLRSISPRKKYTSTDDEGGENLTPKTIKRRPNTNGRPPALPTPGNCLAVSAGEDRRELPSPGVMEVQPTPVKSESENVLQKPKNVSDPSPLQARGEGGFDTEISSADEFSFASLPKEKIDAANRNTLKQNWIKENKTDESKRNPLENLKQQLEKLDELEEQFPPSAHTDTYLRYPFSGPAGTSCELEFYRHRLHLERESVKRAKQALIEQRRVLDGRQAQLKRTPHAPGSAHQVLKEEKELSDMEVHLHRTKALLGEKIIRLKHLEMSLAQCEPSVAQTSPNNTLSEASHSSGFSSSDLDSSPYARASSLRPERYWTDASFNVLQSLENINCEIREIWGILGKQQVPELGPPPLVQYTDLQQHRAELHHPDPYQMRFQSAEIVDRTRGLRDWLAKARHPPTNH